MQKVTGGWKPVIDLSILNGYVTLTKFQMETVVGFEVDSKGRLNVLHRPQRRLFPDPHPSQPYLWFVVDGQVFQFQALCFGLSTAPQVFTRIFSLISAWTHWRGVLFLRYLDNWLVEAESLPLLLRHRDLLLQLCQALGIIINWEKSDLQPSTWAQYLGMIIDTCQERVPFECSNASVSRLSGQVSCSSFSSSEDVAATVRPHELFRMVYSQGLLLHASSSVAPQRPLVTLSPSSSVAEVRRGGSLVAPGGEVGSRHCPAGPSSFSASTHGCPSFRPGDPSI